jgi:DNA replication protein DnaC
MRLADALHAAQIPPSKTMAVNLSVDRCWGVLALAIARAYPCDMARADCELCAGSGWKVVERSEGGAQAMAAAASAGPVAAAGGEPKMVWAVPCDCTSGNRVERALARARIPERYRHCDFENFDTDLYEHESESQTAKWNRSLTQAKLLVQRFAEEFPMGSENGLLLMGTCGVGKTHLVIAVLKHTIERGHSGIFYDYRELLKEIQASYNPENPVSEMSVLEPVLKTEVLVLDDIGSSKPSPWALETVGHILNTRYNEKRVTLLTTNFLDSANDEPLSKRIGERIRSRLYEMCRTVEILAPDFRKERNVSGFRR